MRCGARTLAQREGRLVFPWRLSAGRSRYLPWYTAVSAAVLSVDSQLSMGGPASSDCWGNGVPGAECYGGHARPTAEQLLARPRIV